MDINVVLERPGHRVSRRRRRSAKVAMSHRTNADDARAWFVENYGINILEEWKWHETMVNRLEEQVDAAGVDVAEEWYAGTVLDYAGNASVTLLLR